MTTITVTEPIGLIRLYTCPNGHQHITIISGEGISSSAFLCPAWGCGEWAKKGHFDGDPDLRPSFQWFNPSAEDREELDEATLRYVDRGGLLIQRIDAAALERHGYKTRGG